MLHTYMCVVKKMIEFKLLSFLDKDLQHWDRLNFKENQQTLFSTPKFLKYHKNQQNFLFVQIILSNEVIAFIPLSIKDKKATSHSGATYGGFVQTRELNDEICKFVYEKFIKFLKTKGVNGFFLKIPPKTFIKSSNNQLNEYFIKHMEIHEKEETSFVDLTKKDFTSLEKLDIRRNHKRDIKFYKNNYLNNSKILRIDSKSQMFEYYKVLENNLSKFDKKPTHSLEELWFLINNLPDNIWIDALVYNDKIVSGITNFKLNNYVNYFFYGSNNYYANLKGSMKYLYYESMKNRKLEGYEYIDFGIDAKQSETPNTSLRSFKEGFNTIHENRYLYLLDYE